MRPAAARARRRVPAPPRWLRKASGPVLLLALWQLASAAGVLAPDVLPSPWAMAGTFGDLIGDGSLGEAMVSSLRRVALGLAIGGALGLLLALAAGLSRLGEDLVDAPMQMLRTLPWAGMIPLFIIWFGIDEQPKIALVAFAVAFPLYLNVYAGIRNVDTTLVEAARTLGLGRPAMVRHVILPGAAAGTLVGLRYALGSAWLALVFAEQVNAQSGIGYLITHAREVYRTDIVVVALVVYAFLGLGADVLVRLLERTLLSWRPAFSGT
ncbi:ABC transporter permease subunit [Kitasatospora sp. NPDC088351]|uniref:ABC transporter permease subunit n=1 Tax=Kitasatospora sp. NPDC088351 TaxID=3155180 RepID=UPI0034216F7D